jgi:hypothetical protein
VTTLGDKRLAVSFEALAGDVSLDSFTGETGGIGHLQRRLTFTVVLPVIITLPMHFKLQQWQTLEQYLAEAIQSLHILGS